LSTGQGETVVTHSVWRYEVQACAEGVDLYREAPSWTPPRHLAHARAAGEALARLHHAAKGYTAPARSTTILVAGCKLIAAADPLAALQAQWPARPALAEYLQSREWQTELRSILAPWHTSVRAGLAKEERLWTHNDWHVSNLCWRDDDTRVDNEQTEVTAILDFGLAAPSCALFDLATAIERNAITWLALERGAQAVSPETALALIEGYRRYQPLSAAQIYLLAELLPLVHVDFALSEIEYFYGVLGCRARADIAYDIFLRGHARWFDTIPGKSLLEAIRSAV
jgi:Ser/Thr protein kinase RdoA (MazF antagonist)